MKENLYIFLHKNITVLFIITLMKMEKKLALIFIKVMDMVFILNYVMEMLFLPLFNSIFS